MLTLQTSRTYSGTRITAQVASMTGTTIDKLTIWQQNINKSPASQHTLISSNILTKHSIDIIALQEPSINGFHQSIATKDWVTVYPSTHNTQPGKTQSLT